MKIKPWVPPAVQMCNIGKHHWSVPRLFELSRNLPVMDVPMAHMYTWGKYENLNLRDFVMHMRAVLDADLSFPIILDEDGEIMDGRHRLLKAMFEGRDSVKCVRFEENPPPCRVTD